jgi:DNA-binding NarL/FixJ family response regulator
VEEIPVSTTGVDLIRLVLLGDQSLGRASLARLLATESGFEVAGECGSPAETLEILRASPVDLVVLDLDLGPDHANCFIREARAAGYDGRFLILAGSVEAQYSATALKLGASGIFLKSEAPERLIQAIRVIATGAVWVDRKIIQLLADECLSNPALAEGQRAGQSLENREQKVLWAFWRD